VRARRGHRSEKLEYLSLFSLLVSALLPFLSSGGSGVLDTHATNKRESCSPLDIDSRLGWLRLPARRRFQELFVAQ
jgi:hypothetical protein